MRRMFALPILIGGLALAAACSTTPNTVCRVKIRRTVCELVIR